MNKEETLQKIVERLRVLIDIKEGITVKELLESAYSECTKHFDPQTEDIEELASLVLNLVLQES
jgi:hypothetical protein